MIVYFDREFCCQADLLAMIDPINTEQHRIPWMDDRLLVRTVRLALDRNASFSMRNGIVPFGASPVRLSDKIRSQAKQ